MQTPQERIAHLKENPDLAYINITPEERYLNLPNCHGTSLFVLNASDLITGPSRNGRLLHRINYNGLGYVDRELMEKILEANFTKVQETKEGDLVAIWTPIHIGNLKGPLVNRLEHTAIMLNPVTEEIFEKQETRKGFRHTTINQHISDEFKGFRIRGKNLIVDFYRLKAK